MHLHFTQSLEPLQGAGLGSAALGLHQGFLQNGSDSCLFTTRGDGFKQAWVGVSQFARRGSAKLFWAPEMRTAVGKQIDTISTLHGHGFYVYPNALLGGLARKKNIPLVYHIHGFFDPWILARSKMKKRLVHTLFESANFKHVAWWRALSEKERQQAIHYGVKTPVEVFPNGVHMPATRSEEEVANLAKRYPKNKNKRLLFLSRVHPKKGLDLLFKAWTQLEPAITQDWEIAVFGPNEGGHLSEMETLLSDLKLGDTVRFYGSVSGDDKEAAYRSGDLFVLPSRSEGFPMAVLEAASYGLPVVQTSECNFPELTQAEGAWEAFPEVDSLKQILTEALSADDKEREQRGAAGKALVEKNYQWSAIAKGVDAACKRYC